MAGWQRGINPLFATAWGFQSGPPVRGAVSRAPQTPESEHRTAQRGHTPPDSAGHPEAPVSQRFRSPCSFQLLCVLAEDALVANQGRQLKGVHRARPARERAQFIARVQTQHLVDRGAWRGGLATLAADHGAHVDHHETKAAPMPTPMHRAKM